MRWIVLVGLMVIGIISSKAVGEYGGEGDDDTYKKIPPKTKIIGGVETSIENYPFAVQLIIREGPLEELRFHCGGTLITTLHVLTAAHCLLLVRTRVNEQNVEINTSFEKLCPSNVFIRAGSSILHTGGTLHQGSAIIAHPKNFFYFNDISMLMLATPVSYSNTVKAAILPPQGHSLPENAVVKVIGWGRTSEEKIIKSRGLREASLRTISLNECKTRYQNSEYPELWEVLMNSSVFCAGLLDVGGKDTCQGDSGGPLIRNGVVIGITSLGGGCGNPNYPGLYTDISAFTIWIYDVVLATTSNNQDIVKSSQLGFVVVIIVSILSRFV